MNITEQYSVPLQHQKRCEDIYNTIHNGGVCQSSYGLPDLDCFMTGRLVSTEQCDKCGKDAVDNLRRMHPKISKYCKAYKWYKDDCARTGESNVVSFDVYRHMVPESQCDEMIKAYKL